MLNGIPLRTAGGIVTHREAQPHPVAQLALQLVFPKPRPRAKGKELGAEGSRVDKRSASTFDLSRLLEQACRATVG